MTPTYELLDGDTAIRCLRCDHTSRHPYDVAARYCGYCHTFHPPQPERRIAHFTFPPNFDADAWLSQLAADFERERRVAEFRWELLP